MDARPAGEGPGERREAAVRIAVWSGPRSLSTALMRAWGSRADTAVVDEPFYAAYLAETGVPHPGREDIIAEGETDPKRVVERLLGPVPGGRRVFFQKHMAHHLLPGWDRSWLAGVRSAFLIRHPRELLPSLAKVVPEPGLEDTGLPAQRRLFREARDRLGPAPPVVDATELRREPEPVLRKLCAALDLAFDPAMLSWKPGPRPTDGVWARHWYGSVEASTGFRPPRGRPAPLPDALAPLLEASLPHYRALHAVRLAP